MTYSKAWSINPPLQPSLPWAVEQSTRFCSERETNLDLAKNQAPSMDPVAENDQHDPHCPWFLIGVTAPLVLQSQLVGIEAFKFNLAARTGDGFLVMLRPLNLALNSWLVRSENSL